MKIFAVGGSMRPFIRSGELLEFRVESLEFREGDVVLYKKGNKYFIHRITEKLGNGKLKIEDDAGVVGKHFVSADEIVGKVEVPWYLRGMVGFFVSEIARNIFILGRKAKDIL